MVREKVKAKKARLSPDQCFSLEEDNKSDQELMDEQMLYDEQSQQTKENTTENMESHNMESENMASLETMLEAEDISDASAQLEEYSQRYDQDEEMAQCVPEFVYTPVETKPKVTEAKHRPRMKFTPKRRSPEKAPRRKIKPSKNSVSVTPQCPHVRSKSEDHDEFPKAKKEGTWIQCSKIDCLKWRKLPNNIEPSSMPDRWVCAMNQDLTRTECTASQETCDSQLDFDVVYTPFVAGSLVWAKVPGYPWWPGMVEDDPDYKCCYETDESNVNPISYHVSFIFDKDVSRSWVSYLGIRNFDGTENPNETGPKQKKYAKPLARALIQARNAIDLSLAERIKKYSFNVLYKGQIGSEMDEKPRKTKKRKQPKTSPEPGNPKKTKAIKPDKKIKRGSLTDSEKSSKNSQTIVKKKVKKTKRVLASSDEEESGKEMATDAPTINDTSITRAENSDGKEDSVAKTEEIQRSLEIQLEAEEGNSQSAITKDEVSPRNSLIDKASTGDDEKSEKGKVKSTKKNRPAKTKNEVPKKKKRKSITSEEEEKPTQPKSPSESRSPDHLKVKKKKLKKSEDKPTNKSEDRKSKKKSKFVNPGEAKSASVLNASNASDECDAKDTSTLRERLSEALARDTSTESSMGGFANDTSNDSSGLVNNTSNDSSMDDLTKDTSEEISHTEEPNTTSDESPVKETAKRNYSKESGENKKSKPKKKKPAKITNDSSATKDSTEISAVKPKKFELAFAKKSKSTNEKKVKKVKKISTPKTSASPSEIALEGSSVKPNNTKTTKPPGDGQKAKTTSKVKKLKQTFGKFKAPVKASSKVTPAAKVPRLKASKDEKSREEAKKTLEEVLDIPSSDDPRTNPENYVNIDSLEKDISNLYQELSENAAASTGVAEDVDDVTEASDCVTMEFLDEEISGNTENSEKIPARRLTDSPEF